MKFYIFLFFILYFICNNLQVSSISNLSLIRRRSTTTRTASKSTFKSKSSYKLRSLTSTALKTWTTLNNTPIKNEESDLGDYSAIVNNSGSYEITQLPNSKNIVAEIFYNRVLFEKGWNKLSIKTYKLGSSYEQAFFAGYLEGRISADDIYHFFYNMKKNTARHHKTRFREILNFFDEVSKNFNIRIINTISSYDGLDDQEKKYWSKVILCYAQIEGLMKGYSYEIEKRGKTKEMEITLSEFFLIQADAELHELMRAIKAEKILKDNHVKIGDKDYFQKAFGIKTEDPVTFWRELMKSSRCSAFIKITKDKDNNWTDLLAGHTTWADYAEMLRTYKHYKFENEGPNGNLPSTETTFSSYPGCLSSTDDFVITSNGLLITETTIEVIDVSKYNNVKDSKDYIPNFIRVMVSSSFSKSAEEWVRTFSMHNSGTYSSQWMILDYNVFQKIKGKNANTTRESKLFYILEQVPHNITAHDISTYLYDHSYFGSYNRAFFDETNKNLETALLEKLYETHRFGYGGASRGIILKHFNDKVTDLKSLKDLMRYNGFNNESDFAEDPSRNSSGEAISSRNDLETSGYSGGTDTKVTNLELVKQISAVAISGPTTENNPNLLPFKWAPKPSSGIIGLQTEEPKHLGVPNEFNFPYILMSPNNICCDNTNDVYQFK